MFLAVIVFVGTGMHTYVFWRVCRCQLSIATCAEVFSGQWHAFC